MVNKIESYEFTSGKADNYDVTTADGQLTMQKASVEITLTAGSGEWTYDGEAHGNTEVTVTSGILFPGDELVASASGSVTDVADSAEGNNPVADGYKILHGDEDVTENYVITTVAGTLTILPAEETPEEKPQKPQKEKEEKEEPEEETLPFKDVQKTDYFYDAVKWAWEKGMTAGVTEDLFGPALGCTRAQFVTLLYGAAGSPEVSGDMPFSDVPEDLYFYKPVLWAYQNGITAGNSDGTFGAAQTVTRAQAVTMLYGMKGRPEVSGDMPFSDVPEDAYYYAPVLWAYGQGITAGTGEGAFSPEDPCTRAQIVTMLCAALTE